MNKQEEEKLALVMRCLINTVKNVTELDNVYSDTTNESVSWNEVHDAYNSLDL